MMEVAVYGLPVRMPHWSFGVRYIYQYVQHRMGASRIFEVVFPGNPNRAYLPNSNALSDNTLVTAHVLGHADFSKNNALFSRMQGEVGYRVVEQAASRAHRIEDAIADHGQQRVERVLDAALALEQCVDIRKPLNRQRYPEFIRQTPPGTEPRTEFETRYRSLTGEEVEETEKAEERKEQETSQALLPPYPEPDLLWFIAQYAPEMEPWERDIFLAVREESYYFYPVFACNIMNEGWASYWHARLLREADFLPNHLYLDAIKSHSDVVRPYSGSAGVSLAVNPYHLGFRIWERIVEKEGMDAAFRIRAEEDDFGFIRNHLSEDLATELNLFVHERTHKSVSEENYRVLDADIHDLHEAILAPKFNYDSPRVRVKEMRHDGSLVLEHDADTDGRGLDLKRTHKVLEYIHSVWRRPIVLETVDEADEPQLLETL
jgi:stage V sporulation protein R